MSGFQSLIPLSAFQKFVLQYVLFSKIGCHVENSAKRRRKAIKSGIQRAGRRNHKRIFSSSCYFNLLLLDNETCKCSVDWILIMMILRMRNKTNDRFGKVLRLCQQEIPSLPSLCCKSSSRKNVYRKYIIIGADSEKNNFPFDGSLKSN